MSKKTNDALREQYVNVISEYLASKDEEVLRTGTNEIAIPVVDSEGEESWVVFVVKVPTGSRDGDPYDGYAMAEDYQLKQTEKAEKAAKAARDKAEKIARDEKARAAKAAAKAKHEGK